MKVIFMYLFLSFFLFSGYAQEKKQEKITFGFDGQIAATTNGTFYFFNIGGPAIRLNIKPFIISFNMFPSLSFYDNPARPFITPTLGVGVQIIYKKLIISMPLYLVRETNTTPEYWTFSAGFGYKFGNNHK
jgi:hypothetical protein